MRTQLALRHLLACLLVVGLGTIAGPGATAGNDAPARKPDVHFEPTPPAVVSAMLELASVGSEDVVYDLGCGDGRIVIAAAKRGARGVGIDIDPVRIREARANAHAAGVEDRVQFREGDLFEADVRPATVVMLFLLPHLNLKLRPTLLEHLRPGSRVVSYQHTMGDWAPEKTVEVGGRSVYLWTIPERKGR